MLSCRYAFHFHFAYFRLPDFALSMRHIFSELQLRAAIGFRLCAAAFADAIPPIFFDTPPLCRRRCHYAALPLFTPSFHGHITLFAAITSRQILLPTIFRQLIRRYLHRCLSAAAAIICRRRRHFRLPLYATPLIYAMPATAPRHSPGCHAASRRQQRFRCRRRHCHATTPMPAACHHAVCRCQLMPILLMMPADTRPHFASSFHILPPRYAAGFR
jgi:hypothetical protein